MRILIMAAMLAFSFTPAVAKDRTVSFILPEGVRPSYVDGRPAVTIAGKTSDVMMTIYSQFVGGKDKVVLALIVNNKGSEPLNIDQYSVFAETMNREPMHIYTRAEMEKEASNRDSRRRVWARIGAGLSAAGGAMSSSTTQGTITTPGGTPTRFTAQTQTRYDDPAAQEASNAAMRDALARKNAEDLESAGAGFVPVTIAPDSFGGTLMATDIPKKGLMAVRVKTADDAFEFIYAVE